MTLSHANLLANALQERYERTGDTADVDAAVDCARAAADAAPNQHLDKAACLSVLGHALHARYERTGHASDLDAAIAARQTVVDTSAAAGPDRARQLSDLGVSLRARGERTRDTADLHAAVDLGHTAVDTAAPDDNERARYLAELATSLYVRFQWTGSTDDLDAAVAAGRQAVDATPGDDLWRANRLSGLSTTLYLRFGRTGNLADLDAAVECGRAAVDATPPGHRLRALYLSNAGIVLRGRYERTGNTADLDAAIAAGRDAVATTAADHPGYATSLSSLGSALHLRYQRTGNTTDLDAAVDAGQAAVDVSAADHLGLGKSQTNLGTALSTRYERTGNLADLDAALAAYEAGLRAATGDGTERAAVLAQLGATRRRRYLHLGDHADLDAAVAHGQAAVDATPQDHPDRIRHLTNLCLALHTRYEDLGAIADLDAAVDGGRAAARSMRADDPDRAQVLLNLGAALNARHETGRNPSDAGSALQAFRDAARIAGAPPLRRAMAGREWARLAGEAGDWAQAADAITGVLHLLPQIVGHAMSPDDRRFWLTRLQGLGPLAAHIHLRRGRPEQAWQALESGRGVLLSQALQTRTDLAELRAAHPHLAARVEQLSAVLNQDTPDDGAELPGPPHRPNHRPGTSAASLRQEAAGDWERLMLDIRAQPGFTGFGLPSTIEQLRAAAGDGTVVALNVTGFGCDALILTRDGVDTLPLPALTEAALTEQANRFLAAAYTAEGGIDEVLAWLWDAVAEPVLNHLGHTRTPAAGEPWPRIWWIPTGALTVLPVHAAGDHTRAVLDRVVSSYTPTAATLQRSRQQQRSATGDRPLIVGINDVPHLPRLAFAESEANTVRRWLAAAHPLLGAAGTYDTVTAALPGAHWSHFACHAMAVQADPADSYLALHDRPLRVRDISGMRLASAYLTVLSACTTATGAHHLADESIHIASAFQVAGSQHVIATLWPVSDALAPVITNAVYRRLHATGDTPADAVHHAVRTIRGNEDAARLPHLWASYVHFGP